MRDDYPPFRLRAHAAWDCGLSGREFSGGDVSRRRAIFQPPTTTRAFFRGRAVARFNREIESIQWDEIVFAADDRRRTVELPHPAHDPRLTQVNEAIRDAKSFRELIDRLG